MPASPTACIAATQIVFVIIAPNVPQKDITDELHFLFPHKKKPTHTVKGCAETDLFPPARSGLYPDHPRRHYLYRQRGLPHRYERREPRISTITASANYTENKQFSVPLETNIWTKGNKYNFVGDIHFMKYPQASFGLGSNSWIGNVDSMAIQLYPVL